MVGRAAGSGPGTAERDAAIVAAGLVGRMTRAAVIVLNDAGEVALIERRRDGLRYFLFPGGAVETGETVEVAAVREAAEELGLRVVIEGTAAIVRFGGAEQVYLRAGVVGGTFGSGDGVEIGGSDFEGHGSYVPIWMGVDRLRDADVRPRAIAELIDFVRRDGWPAEPLYLTELPRVAKAICYIVRDGELLVFRHRDHPSAGVQVPAGTLHPDEPPSIGALRETEEETGRSGFRIARALGSTDFEFRNEAPGFERHEIHERHFFLLEPPVGLPDRWSHLAEEGNGDFWFEFSWMTLTPDLVLAADQHAYLARLRSPE